MFVGEGDKSFSIVILSLTELAEMLLQDDTCWPLCCYQCTLSTPRNVNLSIVYWSHLFILLRNVNSNLSLSRIYWLSMLMRPTYWSPNTRIAS